MAKASDTFQDLLGGMGLPQEAGEVMLAAIRRAGYDGDQEQDQFMGIAALTAALRVHEAATRATGRPRGRVGRNDPCPCGSGRKFKKCCQGKGEEAAPEAPLGPPSPLDEPDLIPQMHRAERFAEDMENLDRLFREDRDLCRIRFTGPEILAFLAEEMGDESDADTDRDRGKAGEPGGDEGDRFEGWVIRYLQEVEGEEVLGNLENALVAAAPRWGQSPAELRALALGVALAGMPEDEGEREEANPLHSLIFRCTLQEELEAQERIETLLEKAGGVAAVREKLLAGQPLPFAGLAERLGDLPEMPESAREVVEEALWALGEDIRAGLLPVGLPFPALLPCLTRWAASAADQGPSEEEAYTILTTSAEELGPEDALLLDQLFEDWLEENQGDADPETLARIAFVRSEILSGSLAPFGFDLLTAALYHRRVSSLAGEPVPPQDPSTLADALTAEYLERYGDFLWDEGLPETARRTWRLCELHGPLSPALEEKLARPALFGIEEETGP